jgi:transposase
VARKTKPKILDSEAREQLESGYKLSERHSFRQRCKMVLLKSEGYSLQQVAVILDTNLISVHNWLKRYDKDGIEGLQTKPGQGRKRILAEEHISIVRSAVEQERQRLSQARLIVEESIGKKMSNETLTRFLKVITAVTRE